MKTLVFLVAMLVVASILTVQAGAGPLDGTTFQAEIKDMGKAQGDSDTLVFADGKFRSMAGDAHGFDAASYKATQAGNAWTFTAETRSPTRGTITWRGTIKGNVIEGTATRSKDGKTEGEQVFLGAIKR